MLRTGVDVRIVDAILNPEKSGIVDMFEDLDQMEDKELDAALDSRSERWRVSRMAATDRAILRLGIHELLHGDVPGPVAVNEAIELAKRYGTEASATFVAGILGRVLAERPAAAGG
jgi:transcription antitermination factor NusB